MAPRAIQQVRQAVHICCKELMAEAVVQRQAAGHQRRDNIHLIVAAVAMGMEHQDPLLSGRHTQRYRSIIHKMFSVNKQLQQS